MTCWNFYIITRRTFQAKNLLFLFSILTTIAIIIEWFGNSYTENSDRNNDMILLENETTLYSDYSLMFLKKNTLKNSKNNEDGLTINEEYAKKFTYEKQRQFIEKAKLKYGKNFSMEELENQSSSDYESEDSDAEMINEKVMTKFIDTYIKLKDDKLAKQFLDNKDPVFNDEDFASKGRKKSNEKIEFTVNDALMNYKEEDENIFSVNYKSKKINKEDPEKKEFLKQLEAENNDDNEYIESDVKLMMGF